MHEYLSKTGNIAAIYNTKENYTIISFNYKNGATYLEVHNATAYESNRQENWTGNFKHF